MTEAVPLGELLHGEALFGLTSVRRCGSTPRTLIPVWTLPLRHISSSPGVVRPFTNGVETGWKKCIDPMVGGARSITLYDACTPSSELKACDSGGRRIDGTRPLLTIVDSLSIIIVGMNVIFTSRMSILCMPT